MITSAIHDIRAHCSRKPAETARNGVGMTPLAMGTQ
jgi:hypothetical protein